jgi:hypothetical protein
MIHERLTHLAEVFRSCAGFDGTECGVSHGVRWPEIGVYIAIVFIQ